MQTAVRQQIFERLRGLLGTGVPYNAVPTLERQGLGRFPLMPALGLTALGMGLGMAQPKEAEAAPAMGPAAFVVAKRLLRDFPARTVIPVEEILERYIPLHPWGSDPSPRAREFARKDLYPRVIKPLQRKGVLESVGRGQYQLTGQHPPKAGIRMVDQVLRRAIPSEHIHGILEELGYTSAEIEKAYSRGLGKLAPRIGREVPQWLQGIGHNEFSLPRSLRRLVESRVGSPQYHEAKRQEGVAAVLGPEEHQALADALYRKQLSAGPTWRGMPSVTVDRLKAEDVLPLLKGTGTDVKEVLNRAQLRRERRRMQLVELAEPFATLEAAVYGYPFDSAVQNMIQHYNVPGEFRSMARGLLDAALRRLGVTADTTSLLSPAVPLEDYLPSPKQDAFTRLARLADTQGGTLALRTLRVPGLESLYTMHSKELGALSKGTGRVTSEQLRQAAESAPKEDFFLSQTFWTYGSQSLAKVPHDVYQINLNPARLPNKEDVVRYYAQVRPSNHPNREDAMTVGWLRVDKSSTPKTWIIEEAQSDILAFARRFKMPWPSETYKQLSRWTEVGLNKVLADARTEGIDRVVMHTPESLRIRGGAGFGERKLHELYINLAKRFGFQTAELKASEIQHLQRQFGERLPVYLRIPSIIATTLGAASALSPKETEEVSPEQLGPTSNELGSIPKALGLVSSILGPAEAEAAPFPIRPPIRLPKVGRLSSATDLLKGMLLRGKAIREVRVGREPWRYIIFEDGSYMSLKKPWLRTLAAERGKQRYVEAFQKGEPPPRLTEKVMKEVPAARHLTRQEVLRSLTKVLGGQERMQTAQTFKSADRHVAARSWPTSKALEKSWTAQTQKVLQEIDPNLQPIELVYVRYGGRTFSWPRAYAESMQKLYPDMVKILK